MPSLSNPQLLATTGYEPRFSLADLLQAEVPNLYAAKQAEQQNRALDLQSETQTQENERLAQQRKGLELQAQTLTSQEAEQRAQAAAQERTQRTQTYGTAITGLGTAGQLALQVPAVKTALGLGTATPTAATLGGTSTTSAGLAAEAAGGGTAGVGSSAGGGSYLTGAAATAAPSTAAAGTVGSFSGPLVGAGTSVLGTAGVGAAGGITGTLAGNAVENKVGGVKGKVAGHATGAATGAVTGAALGSVVPGVGTALGAIGGAIFGGLGASFCVIHEAAYGAQSIETKIARAYRDTFLDAPMRRAYYALYEGVAARMQHDPAYRMHMRCTLVDRLIRYGAARVGIPYAPLRPGDQQTAEAFLHQLRVVGQTLPRYVRRNGEAV